MSAGEIEIIGRYFADLTPPRADVRLGIGDDAALLQPPPGCELAVSTDTLTSGVHFAADAAPADVGYKALAVNLSDLAAMGAEPRWALLALTLPSADEHWLQQFCAGLRELALQHSVALVGGDLGRGPLSITLQVIGSVPAGTALRRDGARAGDGIYVSGELGGAALALALRAGAGLTDALRRRLDRPTPRVACGSALRGVAHAAIDISDGLLADLGRLATASRVGAEIELARLPLCREVAALADERQRLRFALAGGDDYELCFCVAPERESQLATIAALCGVPLTRIGAITAGTELNWRRADGSGYTPDTRGYLHF